MKKHKRKIIAAAIVIVAFAVGVYTFLRPHRQLGDGRAHFEITRQPLGEFPEDVWYGSVTASPDFSSIAFVNWPNIHKTGVRTKSIVYCDGVESGEYDDVELDLRFMRRATSKEDTEDAGNWCVAYVAKRREKFLVVVDGVEGQEYDSIGLKGEGDGLGPLVSPDGLHVAYTGRRDGKEFVVVDGVESSAYDEVYAESLTFVGDAAEAACIVRRGQQTFVLRGQEEYGPYTGVSGIAASRDGNEFAYCARRDGKRFVVRNGVEGTQYGYVSCPVFSDGGDRFAYVAERPGQRFLVVDGVEGEKCGDVRELQFSPGGAHLLAVEFGVSEIGERVVLDGRAQKWYREVSQVTFSPDGDHLAYQVWPRQWMVRRWFGKVFGLPPVPWRDAFVEVIDGVEGPIYSAINGPVWSADSAHVGYIGRREGRWYAVIDGREAGEIEDFHPFRPVDVGDPTELRILGRQDRQLIGYTIKLVPDD